MVGTPHVEILRSPTLRFTKTRQLEPKISNLDLHRSNVYCSCFLAKANIFSLLVSFKIKSNFISHMRRIQQPYSEILTYKQAPDQQCSLVVVSFSSGFFAAIRP